MATKRVFREDVKSVRAVLRRIEEAISASDWNEIASLALDAEMTLSLMRTEADNNDAKFRED